MPPTVTLRRTTADDAPQVAAWRAEPAARAFQPLEQYSIAHLRSLLEQRGSAHIGPDADGKFQWIIETPDGDAGWVTVTVLHREYGIGALGYTVTTPFHGQGYATAAVRTVLPIVFSAMDLGLFRLEAVAAVGNTASRRVLEANAFQFESIQSHLLVINGVTVDHARYALNRLQWLDGVEPKTLQAAREQEGSVRL